MQIYYCEVVNHVAFYVLHHLNGLGNTPAIYFKNKRKIKLQENYLPFSIYPCMGTIGHVP
jgi:hypothetical protein